MKLFKFIVFLIGILFAFSAFCNEATDHPALSRYEGAKLIAYQYQDYGKYVLALAEHEEKNTRGHMKYFSDFLDLEGKITRIQYCVEPSEGIDKIFNNYKQALENSGYRILFSTSQRNNWPFWHEDVYQHEWGINALRGDDFRDMSAVDGYRFLTASGIYRGNNIYFAIYINIDKDEAKGDCILVTEDVIEINPMESGLVTAEKINKSMKLNGFVPIYGIHFDSGQWEIKDESRPSLEEIAKFLKENPEKRYYIVGHTDNEGELEANMSLSKKRALAVMNKLIEQYGIDSNRLKAHGVGPLAPVTSNRSDDGMARNRRVVIVEQ